MIENRSCERERQTQESKTPKREQEGRPNASPPLTIGRLGLEKEKARIGFCIPTGGPSVRPPYEHKGQAGQESPGGLKIHACAASTRPP